MKEVHMNFGVVEGLTLSAIQKIIDGAIANNPHYFDINYPNESSQRKELTFSQEDFIIVTEEVDKFYDNDNFIAYLHAKTGVFV